MKVVILNPPIAYISIITNFPPFASCFLLFPFIYSSSSLLGHCHPKIVKALTEQAKNLTLSSRAFYNDQLGPFTRHLNQIFGYDKALLMNSGAEAVETSLKLARKWAYLKKGVPKNEAIVLACSNNFHGRTLGIISMSTDPESRSDFGPFLPNVGPVCPKGKGRIIKYGDLESLRAAFEAHGKNIAALLIEPIQGEAG